MTLIYLLVLLWLMLTQQGCIQTPVGRHPDAPMLILKAHGTAEVAVYDRLTNELVTVSDRVSLEQLDGWTLSKYDWEAFIAAHRPK